MNIAAAKKIQTQKKLHTASIIPLIFAMLFCILLILNPIASRNSVSSALEVCATKLIPSIFPFMVTGELLISLGFGKVAGNLFGAPFEKLFGISRNGAAAYFAGAFCGLPIGGKYALELYKNGDISKNDCERLMGISNNAGIGFVVLGIGVAIWGSKSFGWYLYLTQLFASLSVGLIFSQKSYDPVATISSQSHSLNKPIASAITSAISKSAVNILTVCAFVVFFSTISQTIMLLLSELAFLEFPAYIICSLCEISSGCVYAHNFFISNAPATESIAKILTFFTVGFSGFCIHMQLYSFSEGTDVEFKKYFASKLLIGLICAAAGSILIYFSLI